MAITLWEAMNRLSGRGFTGHFGVEGHRLRDFESGQSFEAKDVSSRGRAIF